MHNWQEPYIQYWPLVTKVGAGTGEVTGIGLGSIQKTELGAKGQNEDNIGCALSRYSNMIVMELGPF